jgi:hypothetical protein
MSDATVRPGGSAHPTRQQLDDLEALMQRMLALPVNQGDDEPGAELPSISPEAGVPLREETAPPVSEQEGPWHPVAPSADLVVSEPVPVSSPAKPQAAPLMKAPAVLARVGRRWPRWIAPVVWPVVWINRTFDNGTVPLGRAGRWIRSRQGRALLGALGLIFIAAAIGWTILSFVGWTW